MIDPEIIRQSAEQICTTPGEDGSYLEVDLADGALPLHELDRVLGERVAVPILWLGGMPQALYRVRVPGAPNECAVYASCSTLDDHASVRTLLLRRDHVATLRALEA